MRFLQLGSYCRLLPFIATRRRVRRGIRSVQPLSTLHADGWQPSSKRGTLRRFCLAGHARGFQLTT